MALPKTFVPQKPFPDFKWKWASVQCTEGLNDPVILLGVLSRMRKLEGQRNYSSPEFAQELISLEVDISDSIGNIRLADRSGERNIIRNSGQYWKAVALIEDQSRGLIRLTPFGQRVADHEISQAEFAATTIKTLKLPNRHIQPEDECQIWEAHGISLFPLQLILDILRELKNRDIAQKHLTPNELIKIIIPLSATNANIEDYANFILWNRNSELNLTTWPDCCPDANDRRIAREFMLFLRNYGYLVKNEIAVAHQTRYDEYYEYNTVLSDEISAMVDLPIEETTIETLEKMRITDIVSDIERKRILTYRISRPNQTRFRKNVLASFRSKCIITNIAMPEVLEAAHIKPVEYSGNDSIANGFCMRLDMHQLFDTGHLRISLDGHILLSPRSRQEYGQIVPAQIAIPDFVSRDFLKWRIDNYNGI